jgi:hypothetical protein
MVEQNKKLGIENVELKRKMELMTQLEKDLSKKNSSNQKIIKSLQAKIQSMLSSLPLLPPYPFPWCRYKWWNKIKNWRLKTWN